MPGSRHPAAPLHREPGGTRTTNRCAERLRAALTPPLPRPQDLDDTTKKYGHVAWFTLFVAAYMLVLYLQASTYRRVPPPLRLRHRTAGT